MESIKNSGERPLTIKTKLVSAGSPSTVDLRGAYVSLLDKLPMRWRFDSLVVCLISIFEEQVEILVGGECNINLIGITSGLANIGR